MSGVHVLPDGTPRQGGMDEDECDQCIHDIADWFVRKADLNAKGAKSADIKEVENELDRELPLTLKSLLLKQNGDLWFDEYKSLSTRGILTTSETLGGVSGWKSSFIPFAVDVDGNALIIDVTSKNGVYSFTDDGKGPSLASTLSVYLEEYRNRLLSGRFEFIEDVGLVERSRK